ncbi:MAG: hypothetical protein LBC73_01310 [Oscillospiraceae bacterium]|jgi:hypothetical protein|nr:hypothetical protein [Oscillospiraceae bacterium]
MKKTIVILITIIIVLFTISCDIESLIFPPPDAMEYYDSIEDAIKSKSSTGMHGTELPYTGEITRLILNETNALFFIINPEGRERSLIYIYFFYVNDESGNTMFSRVMTRGFIDIEQWLNSISLFNFNDIGEIGYSILSCWAEHWSAENIQANLPQRPVWGISQTEKVRNLVIEGQPVTEVIEFEYNGKPIFFWYFEDLETDKRPNYLENLDDNLEYDVGEMDISMD